MFKVDALQYLEANRAPTKWRRHPMRYWDTAATKGGKGAYTAGVKMGIDTEDRVIVLDVVRFRLDSGARELEIERIAEADGKKLVVIGREQEPGGSGKESAETAAKRLTLKGFRVWNNPVRGDKEVRADPFSVQVNLGNVYLVKGAWNRDFVEEMRYFPVSTYKDQIDAASGCFAGLARSRRRIGAYT
jgi:predicted phage terminase large subunit-like protein